MGYKPRTAVFRETKVRWPALSLVWREEPAREVGPILRRQLPLEDDAITQCKYKLERGNKDLALTVF